jgi:hypothetical protein
MTVTGLDLYADNGPVPLAKARDEDGVRFVILKATEGRTFPDPIRNKATYDWFDQKWAEASAVGLLPGAYHFARPRNNTALDEAHHFLNRIGTRRGLLALDLEDQNDGKTMWQRASWALAWLETVYAATGTKPLLYTYHSWINDPAFAGVKAAGYPLWIPLEPVGADPVVQWTHVLGTLGVLDVDTFAGTFDELRALAGITPTPPQPQPQPGDPKENAVLLFQDSTGIYFLTGAGTVHVPTLADVSVLRAAGVPLANPLSDEFGASLRGGA